MTGDLFALTYFGLSAASIAAMTIFLILRQSKPVPVRILLLVPKEHLKDIQQL